MSEDRERVKRAEAGEQTEDEVEAHLLDAERNMGGRNQGARDEDEDDGRERNMGT